jgi:hypothetical protein
MTSKYTRGPQPTPRYCLVLNTGRTSIVKSELNNREDCNHRRALPFYRALGRVTTEAMVHNVHFVPSGSQWVWQSWCQHAEPHTPALNFIDDDSAFTDMYSHSIN